jgi:hypothetical protein
MNVSGVVERLSQTSQNELINIVTIFLGLSVGSKLSAEAFLQAKTLGDLATLVVELLVQEAKAKLARAESAGAEDGTDAVVASSEGFVASSAQLRNLSLATGRMTSREGRLALEHAATMQLSGMHDLATLERAWSQLCDRHPMLCLRVEDASLQLGERPAPVGVDNLAVALAAPLHLDVGELVRPMVHIGNSLAVELGLRVHGCVTDKSGLALALADWAELAAGKATMASPDPSEVVATVGYRHFDPEREDGIADLAYWRAVMSPWIPAANLPKRRLALAPVGLGLNRGPSAALHLDLPVPFDDSSEAVLLAAFALAIARRTGASTVLIERHFERPLPGSVGPWTDSMPIALRDVSIAPAVAQHRIARQLSNGERHAAFGLASCEAQFAEEMKAAGSVPGQFGFRYVATGHAADQVRHLHSWSNKHDLCLEVTPNTQGLAIQLVFDSMVVDEDLARAVMIDVASIAGEAAERAPAVGAVEPIAVGVGTRLATPERAVESLTATTEIGTITRAPTPPPAPPALVGAGANSVVYPVLPSTRAIMSVLRGPHTTRTFIGNWNVNQALLVRPGIDARRMSAALDHLVARHDTLRTHYRVVGDQLLAVVDERYGGKLGVQDLGEPSRAEMMSSINLIAERSFDLARGPLFEVHLLKCGRQGDVVLIHLCEFIADGWSMSLIVDELVRHYFGLGAAGGGTNYAELLKISALPADPSDRAALDAYWRGVMESPAPLPRFGRVAKGHPPAAPGMQAPFQRRCLQVNQAGVAQLRKRGKVLGVNENSLWAAAIMGSAARQAGAETVYFAAIHSMRNNVALRDKIALLAGRLPVRCDLGEAGGFEGLAQQIQARSTTNNEHAFPGLEFKPPPTMPDGGRTAQAEWTQWAYGRVLPEQLVKNSLAAPLVGSANGGVSRILSFEIEALPMLPYGFTRGDFALRPMTNREGVELNFYHDLLSPTPADAEQLLARALDDVGLSKGHIGREVVSETIGDPEDIELLNRGLPPVAQPFGSKVG